MSLDKLPNEMILIILDLLWVDKSKRCDPDYWSLALTSKRLFSLAVKNPGFINWRNPSNGCYSNQTCDARNRPYRIDRYNASIGRGVCPVHGTRQGDYHCIHHQLYPIMAFKYIALTRIEINYVDCILAAESSTFDGIIDLTIHLSHLDGESMAKVISHFKNVVNLTLCGIMHSSKVSNRPITKVNQSLRRLNIHAKDVQHFIMHPDVQLPAEEVEIKVEVDFGSMELTWMYKSLRRGEQEYISNRKSLYQQAANVLRWNSEKELANIVQYIKRFKNDIRVVKVPVLHSACWSRIALEHDLRDVKCKISLDLDTDSGTGAYAESIIDDVWDRQCECIEA